MRVLRTFQIKGKAFTGLIKLRLTIAKSKLDKLLCTKKYSDDFIFETQNKFDHLLNHNSHMAEQLGSARVAIYQNFMKTCFSELSSLNRFKDFSNFLRIRKDYLEYIEALTNLNHYSFLSSISTKLKKIEKYEEEHKKTISKIEALEDAFASALGPDAVEELYNLRHFNEDFSYGLVEKGIFGNRFPHFSADRINTHLFWKHRNSKKITEENIIVSEKRLEKKIQDKLDKPHRFSGYRIYTYKNFAKKYFWELSKKLRYVDENIIRKLRKDYVAYLHNLEILNHAQHLTNFYTSPKKIQNYETRSQISNATLDLIEDYFAYATGAKAIQELKEIRECKFDEFNRNGEKAPKGQRYAFGIKDGVETEILSAPVSYS